jgi:hypothetical protein
MNLVKKIAFSLILVSGLTQQTFGWFDNFKKVMSDNMHTSPVIIGAAAGAVVGLGICASKNKAHSDALSIKKQDENTLKRYIGKSVNIDPRIKFDVKKQKHIAQDDPNIPEQYELPLMITEVPGTFTTSWFYSWTYNKKCETQFKATVYANNFDKIEITQQESTLDRSWPRTFAVVGLFTGIGGWIGYQFKKN